MSMVYVRIWIIDFQRKQIKVAISIIHVYKTSKECCVDDSIRTICLLLAPPCELLLDHLFIQYLIYAVTAILACFIYSKLLTYTTIPNLYFVPGSP